MAARVWIFVLLLVVASPSCAEEMQDAGLEISDEMGEETSDNPSSLILDSSSNDDGKSSSPSFFKRLNTKLDKLLRSFNEKDTNYIEPQHYNFASMIQQTEVFQYMRLKTKAGSTLTMSPDVVFRAGPYFGYKWLFLGYTVDLKNFMKSTEGTYFDLSIYSNQIGLDLYYIENSSNFKIRSLHFQDDIDTLPLEDQRMEALSEQIRGFNIYYITNHKKYSYPAAFSQNTQQKRSAGSALVGIGYSRHKFHLDYNRMKEMFIERLSEESGDAASRERIAHIFDNDDGFEKLDYRSYTLSTGLGYNYVFAHNWLLGASLQAGLSYNVTNTEYKEGFRNIMRNISFNNFSIDTTLRLGLVYNNARWYAGMSSIAHTYNYRTEAFKTSNLYGTVNIYCGINFDIYFKHKRL